MVQTPGRSVVRSAPQSSPVYLQVGLLAAGMPLTFQSMYVSKPLTLQNTRKSQISIMNQLYSEV